MPSRNKSYIGIRVNILNLQKKISITSSLFSDIKKTARETIFSEKQIKNAEINICLCDDRKIRYFNKKYFSNDCATDVIAFNITDTCLLTTENRFGVGRKLSPFSRQRRGGRKAIFLADIIISTDTVILNSNIFKTAPLYELFFCVAHGLLHVLGYEDNTKKKMLSMHKKQERICRNIMVVHKASHKGTRAQGHR